jgi:phosphomannomutase
MSKTKTPLSEQLKPYRSYSKIDETNYEFNNRDEVIQNIKQRYNDATIEEIDGVTIRFEDAAWLNVRKSNSEPLLRLNIEAPNQSRRDALFEEVNAVLKEHGEV